MLIPKSPFDPAGPTIEQWSSRPILPLGKSPMKLRKRITMNPPEEFVAFAAAMSPQTEQVNNPIVIGQGGQAVMVPPANVPTEAAETDTQGVTQAATTEVTPVATVAPTTATTIQTTASQTPTTESPTPTPTQTTAQPTDTTTVMITSAEPTTTWASAVPSEITTDLPTTTTIAASTSLRSIGSGSTSSAFASASISASATSAPDHQPFTRTAPFIFLCVLGALIIVAVLATSLSWVFRRPCFPCCSRFRDDDDDDGLSDLVTSFHSHTPSRSSTIRRSGLYEDDAESALHYRASAFATDPTQSPFLHSGGMYGVPVIPAGAPSIQMPAPAHLYGATGPLEVRNGMPGEMIGEDDGHGTPREGMAGGTPRFLGLDGDGLDVPWSRQTSSSGLVGLGIETHPHSALTSPYISAPDERDYLGPPAFPSPSATDEGHKEFRMMQGVEETSPPPQRAGTWASNLRNTLFAAIAGKQQEEEDRFTRTVLPLHRNSTRRREGFPIVEEKDEGDAAAIGSVFLAPSFSSSSGSTIAAPTKRVPLRGAGGPEGAAERYKRYYAKSTTSSASSESAWSVDNRIPSRLAGGERAKGVKGN